MSELDEILAPIKERSGAATDGPWIRTVWVDHAYPDGARSIASSNGYRIADLAITRNADGDFMAAARTDIPALIAFIEAGQVHRVRYDRDRSECACGWPFNKWEATGEAEFEAHRLASQITAFKEATR